MQSIEGITFNRIVLGEDEGSDIVDLDRAERIVNALRREEAAALRGFHLTPAEVANLQKLVFMSHKTYDLDADRLARHIWSNLNAAVYMAEWDGRIQNPNSLALPPYIMKAIDASRGLLVHVIAKITTSMWIGYEVGVAHALGKPRASITYNARQPVSLPAVIGALHSLGSQLDVDAWVKALP